MTVILGILALVLSLWTLNTISKVHPHFRARLLKVGGGLLALGIAVFLGFRGEMAVAIPLGIFGLGLLGWLPFWHTSSSIEGRVSRIRSSYLDMMLDHSSGTMRGRFIVGAYRGFDLEQLDTPTLIAMLPKIDGKSRTLLVAYLDRRDTRWREHAQGNTASGRGVPSDGKMTAQEAYQILGLDVGANVEAIVRAHRALMKKLHPDQGGSTYLAARVNEAKEVLLCRHR
jgi:hypothetical protein